MFCVSSPGIHISLVITKSGDLPNAISIDNNLVSRVTSNKCLGVLLDEKLTFETHIEYISIKACAGIGALRRIKSFVPLCTLVTLYRSLIQPYFDYCSPLWDTCGKQLKDKLQKIQNRAGRVITGSSYDVRSTDVLNNLKWKTLETRRFHTKATLMYKILNDLSAPQLSNSFVKLISFIKLKVQFFEGILTKRFYYLLSRAINQPKWNLHFLLRA